MNAELAALAAQTPGDAMQRWRFGLACVRRVRHLLEQEDVRAVADVLEAYVGGTADAPALAEAAARAAELATRHRGSVSVDGTAHAAVSATHAVAKALAGRALEAADYAAYAMVYAYACHAVTDPAAYAAEYAWQVETWAALVRGGSADA